MIRKVKFGTAAAAFTVALLLSGCGQKISLKEGVGAVHIELGSSIEEYALNPEDYLNFPEGEQVILDMSAVHTDTAGEYLIRAAYKDQTVDIPAEVSDTTAPVGTLKSEMFEAVTGEELQASNFVDVTDVQEVKVQFVVPLDAEKEKEETPETAVSEDTLQDSYMFDKAGEYSLTIRLTDASGNTSDIQQAITVTVPDTTAPEITAKDRSFTAGYNLDYMKNVTAVDDVDGDLTDKVEVDSSKVKKDVPGTYKAIYTVVDSAGNKAEKEITVTVTVKKQKAEQTSQPVTPGQTQQGTVGGSVSGNSSSGSVSGGSNSTGGSSTTTGTSGGNSSIPGSNSTTTGTSEGNNSSGNIDTDDAGGDPGPKPGMAPSNLGYTPEKIEEIFDSHP